MTDVFASLRVPMVERPFPIEPLLEAARAPSITQLARELRLSGSSVSRANELGLSIEQADTWACRLGMHPAQVWADWYELTGGITVAAC